MYNIVYFTAYASGIFKRRTASLQFKEKKHPLFGKAFIEYHVLVPLFTKISPTLFVLSCLIHLPLS